MFTGSRVRTDVEGFHFREMHVTTGEGYVTVAFSGGNGDCRKTSFKNESREIDSNVINMLHPQGRFVELTEPVGRKKKVQTFAEAPCKKVCQTAVITQGNRLNFYRKKIEKNK